MAAARQADDGDGDGYYGVPAWRDTRLRWNDRDYLGKRAAITSLCSHRHEAYKVLVVGPANSGKSSVISTIFTALRNECSTQIAFSEPGSNAITTKFHTYNFQESLNEKAIRVTLCDTMGIESINGREVPTIRDIEHIMDGHVMDGYEFQHESISYNSPFFKPNPGAMDKIHAMVVVMENAIFWMHPETSDKLRELICIAKQREIRTAVVLTKIDNLCRRVDQDLTYVFNSPDIELCVRTVSEEIGISRSSIFPMQNYTSQEPRSVPKNILALYALENILALADEAMKSQARTLSVNMEHPLTVDLLDTPWRPEDKLTPEAVETMWSDLAELQVNDGRVKNLRLCFVGPLGSGKSSFINSIISEFYKRIVTFAPSTTTHYKEYQVRQGRSGPVLPMELVDTMGLMPQGGGIHKDDIATVLDGMVNNGTAFNARTPLPRNDSLPLLSKRMHLLGLVVNGSEFDKYPKEMISKMEAVLNVSKIEPRAIPCVVLVSHIDEICEHVASDPTKVYRSQQVKKCVENIHEKLKIPLVDIWPICNYDKDTEVDWKKSALLLQALIHQAECAQDYVAGAPVEQIPTDNKGWFWWCDFE